ncbi:hypothetical protein HDU84_008551 [Entophlyctis sp. JEL0112]|nr:hypothetical protein HDU84_008551 [Entophlyctis sp. JEL0112]
MAVGLGSELQSPPSDTVSSVAFSRFDAASLLVSSWDKYADAQCVRLYDAHANALLYTYTHEAAVLSAAFAGPNAAVSGGLDKSLRYVDLTTGQLEILGGHDDALGKKKVKSVVSDVESGLIASGSWDKTVKLYDLRKPDRLVAAHTHPHKVHSMDSSHGKLVVATADRLYFIYDMRNLGSPLIEERTGQLKMMTRCVACMPNGEGYATASIEGRVSVEFFDNSEESQKRKYAFKCHREKQDGIEIVHPVNALAFHPIHGTFASGGTDGNVSIWDGLNKKRLKQYEGYPAGISALGFSRDGSMLAVGSSYTFEAGEIQDRPVDRIFMREIGENEARPKSVANATTA